MSCKNLCKPKNLGGLGLRKTTDKNKAMLSKLPWSLVHKLDALATKAIMSKYGSFFDPKELSSTSKSKGKLD